jgi:hypothetical protein
VTKQEVYEWESCGGSSPESHVFSYGGSLFNSRSFGWLLEYGLKSTNGVN